jgi:SAM-dependent methyltransferase
MTTRAASEPGGTSTTARWKRALTNAYRLYWFYGSPTKLVIRRTTLQFFAGRPPSRRLLEIGGGASMVRPTLERACRPSRIVSSDIEPTGANDVVCDAQALPFRDGAFDVVAGFEVLEHLPDTHRCLSEAERVIEPGGHVIMSLPFLFGVHDHQDFYRFTVQGLHKVFADHGMPIVVVKKSGGIWHAMLVLLTEYLRNLGLPPAGGWRSRGWRRRAHLAASTVLSAPLVLLSWVGFALDAVVDRDSRSPSGLVLIARRTS